MSKSANVTAITILVSVLSLTPGWNALAADCWFTNGVGSQSYNVAANWNPSGVPGAVDNVWFTNNANYIVSWSASVTASNAVFGAAGGVTNTLQAGSKVWTLADTLTVGKDAWSAQVLKVDGGSYAFRSIMLTNTDATYVGSTFLQFKNGTLTTTGDTEIRVATNGFGGAGAAPFIVGMSTVNGDAFTWNIQGGTTKILTAGALAENGNALFISGGPGGFGGDWRNGRGIVNVSGPNTVLTNNNWLQIGRGSYRLPAQLTISNGARMYTAGTAYIGWTSPNNTVVVNGANSLWNLGGAVVIGKNSTGGNMLVVTNGGRVAAAGFGIEEGGPYCKLIVTGTNSSFYSGGANAGFGTGGRTNLLLITDGGRFLNAGNFQFGKNINYYSPGNEIRVTGAGSTFTNTGTISMEGSNGVFSVTDGGRAYWGANGMAGNVNARIEVTGTDSFLSFAGCAVSKSCSVAVSNGAVMEVRSGQVWLGTTGTADADKLASLIVTGPGSRFAATNSFQFYVGLLGNAQILVNNGGQVSLADPSSGTSWGFTIGYGVGKTGTVEVAGAGSEVSFSATGTSSGQYGSVRVGESGVGRLIVTNRATFGFYSRNGMTVGTTSGAAGSTVLVADGGLLDFRRQPDATDGIIVSNFVGNSVSNIGGIFQFAFPAPNVIPGAFGNVVINGGTLSFAGINTADVKGNWTGALTNILFLGENTFRLNGATNINNANQTFTFATGLGATNYTTLALINGAQWRGGTATIGNGGRLLVGTGTNTVAAGVTFTSGGKLAFTLNGPGQSSYLQASGATVNLDNATLEFTLGTVPQKDVPYSFLGATGGGSITGSLQSNAVTASCGGTNYLLNVRNSGGTLSIVWATTGTLIRVL